MGAVYKAEHRRMGRTVALKMISPTALRDAEALARFRRETMAMEVARASEYRHGS